MAQLDTDRLQSAAVPEAQHEATLEQHGDDDKDEASPSHNVDQDEEPEGLSSLSTEHQLKRPLELSSPESQAKRPRPEASDAVPQPYCPVCSQPCWRCNVIDGPPRAPSTVFEEPQKDAIEGSIEGMSSTTTSETSSENPNKRRRKDPRHLGPKQDGFDVHILGYCGMRINSRVQRIEPNLIFADLPPPPEHSCVFLSPTVDEVRDIAEQITLFISRKYDETTLAFLLCRTLVLADPFVDETDSRSPMSLRRDKWKPGRGGPPVPGDKHWFNWNIEPDATYAVSINMFNETQREKLATTEGNFLLAERNGACPYLTIEYKCACKGGTLHDARNQVAAASLIWLYHWREIKEMLNSTDFSEVKHYSIIIVSESFEVWESACDGPKYIFRLIHKGLPLGSEEGVRQFVTWNNAIHAWGLGPHARRFKTDVGRVLDPEHHPEPLPSPPGSIPGATGYIATTGDTLPATNSIPGATGSCGPEMSPS